MWEKRGKADHGDRCKKSGAVSMVGNSARCPHTPHMHVYIYAYIYTRKYTYTYINAYIYTCACTHLSIARRHVHTIMCTKY